MKREDGMHRSLLQVGFGIGLSRILGLARDVVFAQVWGTGTAIGAFIFAFTIPNLFRALLGEGGFSAAFVPVFSEKLEQSGRVSAWRAAQKIISILALALLVIVVLVSVAALAALVFLNDPQLVLAMKLLPWMMPYTFFICLAVAFGAVLNTHKRFALTAATPLLLNVALMAAALAARPLLGDSPEQQVYMLAYAVVGAGALHLLLHMIACRRQEGPLVFDPDWRAPEARRVIQLLAPVLIGTGVVQVNTLIDRVLASMLGNAAISSLYYSQRVVYLPVGLFGVALGMVSLPFLSRAWARGDLETVRASLEQGLRQLLFLTIPTAVFFFLLRSEIVQLLFERGTFDSRSTRETVWALAFYLPGIPAFACAKVAVTPFHATQDTRTPLRIALYCLGLNIVLNLILMRYLAQGGLALATTICSWINVVVLLYLIRGRIGSPGYRKIGLAAVRLLFAAAAAAAVGYLVLRLDLLPAQPLTLRRAATVALTAAVFGVTYAVVCLAVGAAEIRELLAGLKSRSARSKNSR